jgi:hypothetical protein
LDDRVIGSDGSEDPTIASDAFLTLLAGASLAMRNR